MTTVDIESLLAQDELRSLLETSEQTGSIRAPDVTEIVESHELGDVGRADRPRLLARLEERPELVLRKQGLDVDGGHGGNVPWTAWKEPGCCEISTVSVRLATPVLILWRGGGSSIR